MELINDYRIKMTAGVIFSITMQNRKGNGNKCKLEHKQFALIILYAIMKTVSSRMKMQC